MVKKKAQLGTMVLLMFAFIFIIMIVFFAVFIIKNVNDVKEEVLNNTLDSNSNITDQDFGEPIQGTTQEEKIDKLKDPNIAPPELSG